MRYGVCLSQCGIQHLYPPYLCSVQSGDLGISAKAWQSTCSIEHVCHSMAFNICAHISAECAVRVSWLSCYSLAANLYYGECRSQRSRPAITCVHQFCTACSQWILAFLLKPSCPNSQLALWNMSVTARHSTLESTYLCSKQSVMSCHFGYRMVINLHNLCICESASHTAPILHLVSPSLVPVALAELPFAAFAGHVLSSC